MEAGIGRRYDSPSWIDDPVMMCFAQRWRRRLIPDLCRLLLPVLTVYGFTPAGSGADESARAMQNWPVLMTASAVRKLSSAEASRGVPVRLVAVVTFYDSWTDVLFVQDRTAGLFVRDPRGTNVGLCAGQLVELGGVTRSGAFGPIVVDSTIRVQGNGRVPSAQPMTAENLFAGAEDGKWVEVQGIVNSMSLSEANHWLDLDVAVLDGHFKAHLPGFEKGDRLPERLVDARVRLRGVARAEFNRRGSTLGFELFVPSLESIQVLRPAPANPFDLPVRPINALLQPDRSTPPGHRVRVRGTLTLKWSNRQIYLQDATGAAYAQLMSPLDLEPGTPLEVVGFPKAGTHPTQLRQCEWRQTGNVAPVAVFKTTTREVRQRDLDSVLMELDASKTTTREVRQRDLDSVLVELDA